MQVKLATGSCPELKSIKERSKVSITSGTKKKKPINPNLMCGGA